MGCRYGTTRRWYGAGNWGYIHNIEGNNPDDPKDAAVGENPGPERGIRGYRFSDGIKSGLCYQATIPRRTKAHKGVEFNPEKVKEFTKNFPDRSVKSDYSDHLFSEESVEDGSGGSEDYQYQYQEKGSEGQGGEEEAEEYEDNRNIR